MTGGGDRYIRRPQLGIYGGAGENRTAATTRIRERPRSSHTNVIVDTADTLLNRDFGRIKQEGADQTIRSSQIYTAPIVQIILARSFDISAIATKRTALRADKAVKLCNLV